MKAFIWLIALVKCNTYFSSLILIIEQPLASVFSSGLGGPTINSLLLDHGLQSTSIRSQCRVHRVR
jgi:hypothetical protein